MRLPFGMVGPAAALILFGLGLTFAAGPLYAYTERAALALTDRTPYVEAVLPDGKRGKGVSVEVTEEAAGDDGHGAASSDGGSDAERAAEVGG